MRSFGAGLGWSLVAKVYRGRIESSDQNRNRNQNGEEEWESELGGAVLEALGREEKSLEVGESLFVVSSAHRSIANLFVRRSPQFIV